MSKNIWFVADLHFGHMGVCRFENNGVKDRPWDDPAVMDEALIENWNSVVGPYDRVYVLGDLAMKKQHIKTVGRCNGKKVLVKGNHDIFDLNEYTPYFEDIRSYVVGGAVGSDNRYIASHIPIHPGSIERFNVNIHGHLHTRRVLIGDEIDTRYFSVSVERINFTPIEINDLFAQIRKEKNRE